MTLKCFQREQMIYEKIPGYERDDASYVNYLCCFACRHSIREHSKGICINRVMEYLNGIYFCVSPHMSKINFDPLWLSNVSF